MAGRVVVLTGLVVLAILLKTTVLPAVAIGTFRPDVLVLVVVAVALAEGPDSGIRLGFAAGLLQDLLSGAGALVGVGALIMMGVGYAGGLSRPYVATATQVGGIAVAGVLAAVATLAAGFLGLMFGTIQPSVGRVLLAAVVVGLYSAAVAPLVLRPVQRMMREFAAPSLGGGG